MAVQDSDLLLVQRGNQPYRETVDNLSTKIRGDIDPSADIPIASASQLGVIRIGNNLQIDANGIVDAVIPAGLEYQGVWTDPNTPPTGGANGDFWVWDGGNNITLNNALWGTANGDTVNAGDRIFYDGTTFEVVPGGGGGIVSVNGTAPIVVDNSNADQPDVSITEATDSQDGYMTKEAFSKLDGIEGGAEVNIDPTMSYTSAADSGTLTLNPGGDTTTLPGATDTEAGLMSASDKAQLDSLVSTPGGVASLTAPQVLE